MLRKFAHGSAVILLASLFVGGQELGQNAKRYGNALCFQSASAQDSRFFASLDRVKDDRVKDAANDGVKEPPPVPIAILQGPVVEGTGDTWAVISWTTNIEGRAASIVYAGIHKNSLREMDQTPQAPDKNELASYREQEYEHLVRINNLQPGTTYYFKADSGEGNDHGIESRSGLSQFTTKAAPVK